MLYPFFISVFIGIIIIINIIILNIKVSTKFECIKKRDSSDMLILFYLFSGVLKQKYKIPITNFPDLFKVVYELLLGEKGILVHKKGNSLESGNKNKVDKDNRNYRIIQYIKPYLLRIQKYLADRNKIHLKLNLKIIYGANDAFWTGILGGLLYIITGSIDSLFTSYFNIEEKNINIQPDFTKNVFELEALCILNVRLVNIIKAGLFFLLAFINDKFKNTVRR
ncbi:MAG: DUF2953 domain-containing protein [Clostridiaceae bacterium]|nr:DUF2953 domain-containing protein [Clostridiaceae bacterium]